METIHDGERIFIWRHREGLTSVAASKRFGKQDNWFWSIEEGYYDPPENLQKILADEKFEPRDEGEYVALLLRRTKTSAKEMSRELDASYSFVRKSIKNCENVHFLNAMIDELEKRPVRYAAKNPWWHGREE